MIGASDWDTIAAISTPYGESGIGIVRVSGPGAKELVFKLFQTRRAGEAMESHRVYYGEIVNPLDRSVIDEALVLFMEKPRTYTREDVLEIQCHGGPLVLRRILECVLREGARLAEPGEFTKRAFLNGRIDLAEAEAVIETIRARTPEGLRLANEQLRGRLSGEVSQIKKILLGVLAQIEAGVDFPEEDVENSGTVGIEGNLEGVSKWMADLISSFEDGRTLRDGVFVAIVGRTNVGKSSLLNALLGDERAIVTAVAGTTRDVVEDTVSVSGMRLRVVDTAGIRKWRNPAERESIRRTKRMLKESDLALVVVDRSRRLNDEDGEIFELVRKKKSIVVLNKTDLPGRLERAEVERVFAKTPMVEISARTGQGLERLREEIYDSAVRSGIGGLGDRTMLIEVRHKRALEEGLEAVERAKRGAGENISPELVALEIRSALEKIGEIVGETVSEDILERVFSQFCIGK